MRSVALLLVVASAGVFQPGRVAAQSRDTILAPAVSAPDTRGNVLLDVPVERSSYRLGPGDEVTVSMFGDLNRQFTLNVGPEGTIVIPSVGVVRVLGLTIDEAQAATRRAVSGLYRNVDARLNIAALRRFKIYVLGDVPEPGVRIANAATRVSELVPQMFRPQADTRDLTRRRVTLRRISGDTLHLDLLPFLFRGDMSANPVVQEGDVLIVPRVDEFIEVHGSVSYPGRYEFRAESLAALLENVNGRARLPANAAGLVHVARGTGAERVVSEFTEADAFGARGRAFALQPFDVVFVPQVGDFMRDRTARVQGQVVRPGFYPITPNVTTLYDLIEMAGGLLPDASLVTATLRRSTSEYAPPVLDSIPVESLTDAELRARRVMTAADASNVVVDFETLMASRGVTGNVTIQPGDVLTIPRTSDEIAVLGAVANPGRIRYTPGEPVDFYLDQAGGTLDRADEGGITVVRAKLRTEISVDDVRGLDPGDQIIVPFERKLTFMQRFQTASSIMTGISGIVLTILAVRQVF